MGKLEQVSSTSAQSPQLWKTVVERNKRGFTRFSAPHTSSAHMDTQCRRLPPVPWDLTGFSFQSPKHVGKWGEWVKLS